MATTASGPQPVITLHWLEASRSQRILWLFEELGVPYELKTWKRGKDKLADPKLKEIHPLGKSPIVTIDVPGSSEPIVLIESAAITEYICDHYGKNLIPTRWQEGKENQVGGETEAWLRYRTFMHYAEGSLMQYNVFSLIVKTIRESPVPFFIRPVTNGVASKLSEGFLQPNYKTHWTWVESQLKTSPDGGLYLCGKDLSAADIIMSFPLEAGQTRSGLSEKECPLMWGYLDRLHQRPAYKRAIQKIESIGEFKTDLSSHRFLLESPKLLQGRTGLSEHDYNPARVLE